MAKVRIVERADGTDEDNLIGATTMPQIPTVGDGINVGEDINDWDLRTVQGVYFHPFSKTLDATILVNSR
jgi:hypothetical protein